jgi:hypothetical protein
MGYDVHITRAEDRTDSASAPIALAEWLNYVAGDPEMRLDGVAVAHLADQPVLGYESAGLAVWVAYSGHDVGGNRAWFDWRNGCVIVKNPDAEILDKMKRIAAALGTLVVGDDGERY